MIERNRITNKAFAVENEQFREACVRVFGLNSNLEEPLGTTTRQASKFRNKKGLAYKHRLAPQGG